ncbi:hypothetical protein PoB_001694000 [Plakobranchus ocellatus]|uniref:Uncharacterized protein n=1 Tax=Plakobranchus ocellatus TaxID=259542 RepID=A0AAV3Z5L1_9GAST|nr:hypothetical protein PoB_001694000 [Plakobranchus ocellatus]
MIYLSSQSHRYRGSLLWSSGHRSKELVSPVSVKKFCRLGLLVNLGMSSTSKTLNTLLLGSAFYISRENLHRVGGNLTDGDVSAKPGVRLIVCA